MQENTCSDHPKHYCGLFGIYGHKDAAKMTQLGLYALQHRGEESAGIVSSDGKALRVHKGMGLVGEVFADDKDLNRLLGDSAIGHVRYSTTGSSLLINAQPLVIDYSRGSVAVGHNGNLTNASVLRDELEAHGSIFQTTLDSEIIVHLMARPNYKTVEEGLIECLKLIKGAYSLVFLTEDELVGVRDPLGFRPLVLGKLGGAYVLASETCALDLVDATFIREIEPGEIVFIGEKGLRSVKPFGKAESNPAHCIFEHIYFARPDSIIFGDSVHLVRQRLGERLAKEHPADADIVIPIPDSGNSAALGFSHASGIPYERGLIRNHYIGRIFIQPHQFTRELGVRIKLNTVKDILKGKRVVVVDDSIVRGTTSKMRVESIRKAGAKEIHMRISCPPHRSPCFYGIDFPTKKELIASIHNVDEIKKYLGVDSLGYLSVEGLLSAVSLPKQNYCIACFTGQYPIPFGEEGDKYAMEKRRCGD